MASNLLRKATQGALSLFGGKAGSFDKGIQATEQLTMRGPHGEYYAFPKEISAQYGVNSPTLWAYMRRLIEEGQVNPVLDMNTAEIPYSKVAKAQKAMDLAQRVKDQGLPRKGSFFTPEFDALALKLSPQGTKADAVAALSGPQATKDPSMFLHDLAASDVPGAGGSLLRSVLKGPLYDDTGEVVFTPIGTDATMNFYRKFGMQYLSPAEASTDPRIAAILKQMGEERNARDLGVGIIKRAEGGKVRIAEGGWRRPLSSKDTRSDTQHLLSDVEARSASRAVQEQSAKLAAGVGAAATAYPAAGGLTALLRGAAKVAPKVGSFIAKGSRTPGLIAAGAGLGAGTELLEDQPTALGALMGAATGGANVVAPIPSMLAETLSYAPEAKAGTFHGVAKLLRTVGGRRIADFLQQEHPHIFGQFRDAPLATALDSSEGALYLFNPAARQRFDALAMPDYFTGRGIDEYYTDSQLDLLHKHLNDSGFASLPHLRLDVSRRPPTKGTIAFDDHDGRHRLVALEEAGQPSTLLQLFGHHGASDYEQGSNATVASRKWMRRNLPKSNLKIENSEGDFVELPGQQLDFE